MTNRYIVGQSPELRMFEGLIDWEPRYQITDEAISLHDPVYGAYCIERPPSRDEYDNIWWDLADSPLVQRSTAIEQLTLPSPYTTIPNTANFSRWEHVWGSAVFVRRMLEGMGEPVNDRDATILQLRTFVSDLGHTAFSHLGDWISQGKGGAENQHDVELRQILEATDVTAIIERYGITAEEVVFPSGIQDFVECHSPDLNTDRIDYSMREINRWQDTFYHISSLKEPGTFSVDVEGDVVINSYEKALAFAKGYSILPTEHWGEPVHRLQLQLLEELVKHSILHHPLASLRDFNADQLHVRDTLYAVDSDIMANAQVHDEFMQLIDRIMRSIGIEQRDLFVKFRKEEIARFMVNDEHDFPDPSSLAEGMSASLQWPHAIDISPIDALTTVDGSRTGDNALVFYLPPLKPRCIDPYYLDESGVKRRLSEHENYQRILAQQKAVMNQAFVARMHVSSQTKRAIEGAIDRNSELWAAASERPRLLDTNPEAFRRLIGDVAFSSASNILRVARG